MQTFPWISLSEKQNNNKALRHYLLSTWKNREVAQSTFSSAFSSHLQCHKTIPTGLTGSKDSQVTLSELQTWLYRCPKEGTVIICLIKNRERWKIWSWKSEPQGKAKADFTSSSTHSQGVKLSICTSAQPEQGFQEEKGTEKHPLVPGWCGQESVHVALVQLDPSLLAHPGTQAPQSWWSQRPPGWV